MKSSSSDHPAFSWWDMAKALFFLLDKNRKRYLALTSILILIFFYELVPTFIVGRIVDFFTNYTPGSSLNIFYWYVGILSVSWGLVSIIRLTVKNKLNNIRYDVTYFTRVKGFERLMDFSIKWHDSENTGNKVQKIQSGVDALNQLQRSLGQDLFYNVTSIFGVLVAMLFLNPYFSLYSLIFIAIFLCVQLSFYKKIVQMTKENNILAEKASGTYFEGVNNLLTIKTLGAKEDFKSNIDNREKMNKDFSIRRATLMNDKWKSFQIVNALSIGGILIFAGQSYVAGIISLGSIFIVYNYFQRVRDAIAKLTDSTDDVIQGKVSISRMMPIFWESVSKQGHLDFPRQWNSIEVDNIVFKYPQKAVEEGKEVVRDAGVNNLSISISKNQKIGIVGRSGSGKSTFAKLLLGLYDLDSGKMSIGKVSLHDMKHSEITDNISLVLQDSEMFNLSLKENITLMRKFDEGLFTKAIEISQLEDVISKLPNGIDTLIGEKGYRLSGGERQRIGIARAIYKDPQVLVFDEATSSLDSKTERMIQEALEKNLTQKTVISIAHRISTLQNVDKIMVFENGTVVEEGSFKGLSENRGSKFREIYEHQSKEEKE